MKAIIKATYHFEQDGPGDAPDEGSTLRAIKDLDGLLALGVDDPCSGPELRAIKAMTEGFTLSQYRVYKLVVARAIDARRARHRDAGINVDFSKAVLDQLAQTEARAQTAFEELDVLISMSRMVHVTGLEPNAAERAAAFVATSVGRSL